MFAAEESILDALPDQPDPAAPGAQSIPLPPTSVQAMRCGGLRVWGGVSEGHTCASGEIAGRRVCDVLHT